MPFVIRTNRALRAFVIQSLVALLLLVAVATPELLEGGTHGATAIIAGLFFAAIAGPLWRMLRGSAERLANSWTSFRIGPVRIINHALWGFISSAGGILLIGTFTGPGHVPTIACASGGGLIGAGIWAQYIEGSAALSRPFGFYGGLLGIIIGGSIGAVIFGTPVWLILAAVAASGPFIQAAGRVRCLIQGCCHGSETSAEVGIRVTHPISRVCRLAHLDNVPIHATQLYSILWNIVTGVFIFRLWMFGAPLHVIGGLYLLANGLGRFVEEAYRGEPQTPIYARLRLYQWLALAQMIAGGLITALGKSVAGGDARGQRRRRDRRVGLRGDLRLRARRGFSRVQRAHVAPRLASPVNQRFDVRLLLAALQARLQALPRRVEARAVAHLEGLARLARHRHVRLAQGVDDTAVRLVVRVEISAHLGAVFLVGVDDDRHLFDHADAPRRERIEVDRRVRLAVDLGVLRLGVLGSCLERRRRFVLHGHRSAGVANTAGVAREERRETDDGELQCPWGA